jgi:hypothetical protein
VGDGLQQVAAGAAPARRRPVGLRGRCHRNRRLTRGGTLVEEVHPAVGGDLGGQVGTVPDIAAVVLALEVVAADVAVAAPLQLVRAGCRGLGQQQEGEGGDHGLRS